MSIQKGKILLCSNDLVQSIKTHKLVEHRLFYNLYYYYKLRRDLTEKEFGTIEGYDRDSGTVYLNGETTRMILTKKYSRSELKDLVENKLPKEIRVKDTIGFITIFEYIYVTEELGEWEIKYKFTDTFIELADFMIPIKRPHTALDLNEMKQLESKYSQRLYEIYKQYSSNIGTKGQGNFKMKREYMYEYFNINENMKISEVIRQGINPARKELNEKLGYSMQEPKLIKKGNKITHIHFIFH